MNVKLVHLKTVATYLFCCILINSLLPVDLSVAESRSAQIGSICKLETQTALASSDKRKILICVKEIKGLRWVDMDLVTVDKRLNDLLPSCKESYIKAFPRPTTSQTNIFLKLADGYFFKQNLLPIKLISINPISIDLAKLGIIVCSNGIGIQLGDRSGFVPPGATEAWEVLVTHKPNKFGQDNFLQIVRINGSYKIVGASTSP